MLLWSLEREWTSKRGLPCLGCVKRGFRGQAIKREFKNNDHKEDLPFGMRIGPEHICRYASTRLLLPQKSYMIGWTTQPDRVSCHIFP